MSESRRVERLHLQVTRREQIARASNLVQDALQTASLPPHCPGAVLLVRRLDLGTVWLNRGSQLPARRITEELRRLARHAVAFTHPSAGAAPAVWLEDSSEALAELCVRLVLGPAAKEWFWSTLASHVELPSYERRPLAEALARLLAPPALANQPPPQLMAARTLELLMRRGYARTVLAKVSPTALAAAAPRLHSKRAFSSQAPALSLAPAWRELLAWASFEWRLARDPRSVWLARCAVAASYPSLIVGPRSERLVAALLQQFELAPIKAFSDGREQPPARPRALELEPIPDGEERASRELPATSQLAPNLVARPENFEVPLVAASEPRHADPLTEIPAPGSHPPRIVHRTELDRRAPSLEPFQATLAPPPPLTAAALTDFGGALFLVPVLNWLGLDSWIASNTELNLQAFGVRVLFGVLDSVRCPALDPMRRALASKQAPANLERLRFVMAPHWWFELCQGTEFTLCPTPDGDYLIRDARSGLWLAQVSDVQRALPPAVLERLGSGPNIEPERAARAHLDAWIHACILACKRRYGLDLARVLCRRALVSANETHVDVVFPISAVDMEIRRRGLDANPGWTPFLARVFTFYYVEQEEWLRLVTDLPVPTRTATAD
jgi:hypothetical protein